MRYFLEELTFQGWHPFEVHLGDDLGSKNQGVKQESSGETRLLGFPNLPKACQALVSTYTLSLEQTGFYFILFF